MKKNVLFFLLCAFCMAIGQAQDYTVSGTVKDEFDNTLESATVFVETIADSTLINYTVTNQNGVFELEFKTKKPKARVVITYNGYQTYRKELTLTKETFALGTVSMQPYAMELEGVSVVGESAPITVKADTLEFNASSFKVAPDSNVEQMLKQLPGVDVKPDGTITVNGKEVNNILVNGKPFFGSDGKIATQNLPAELIEKIQVTNTKTDEEELSGDKASGDNKTINLTIAEDKNKGLFGKAMAGYGTDDRYESSLLFNTFKGDRKISVLASSNNINSVGFSMDEVFDNMGGGRNSWDTFDELQSATRYGITQSNMIGFNYADSFLDEKIEPNLTYYFTETNTDNDNVTSTENFQPDRTTFTNSNSVTDNYSRTHTVSGDRTTIKIDSTLTIRVNPNFKQSTNVNNYTQAEATTDEEGALLNDSQSKSVTNKESTSFENRLYLFKKLAKKGRGYNVSFNNTNSRSNTDLNTQSETNFYETGDPSDIRDQNRFTRNTTDEYRLSAGFREPLTDSLRLNIDATYKYTNDLDQRNTFDFDGTAYTDLNAEQSYYYDSKTNTFSPEAGLSVQKKNLWLSLDLGADIIDFKNRSVYVGATTELNQSYVFPTVSARGRIQIGKSKSIYMNYNYDVSLPSAQQLLPVANLSNPLSTIIGNPDLDPTRNNNLYFNFNNFDFSTRTGLFIWGGGSTTNNQVVSSTTYDDANKATTTYENLDDVYSGFGGFSYSKSFKGENGNSLRYRASIDANYSKSKGLTNAELYESDRWTLSPGVSVTYEIPELVTIEPSYRLNYYDTKYDNYVIDATSNVTHTANVQTTLYWPKNVVWGNDFGYTYNSNIADGFRKDFYLWNMSLGYNFYKDRFLAKVKVYDLLDQNLSATRTITPTAIVDEQNTVLKRYVMFSLTYNLEMFGGQKKKERHFMRF
ncbi:Carboxypeptidase regulatory-like domain-containing protein [Pustulibacterium marinum]|uniref:Carboxypeptidase regulatory-like domain-containing protein n=1 Tax=Pustulibacterium marinum TaxID=1224947 RepID=A0A1I7F2W3_9FLAO|nr:outer membrane beta-barrel protein [Pustulibacterium marinum]SFU30532.1 Carboxypeptidase regulatory-like domain-containing protein [Pustulibacterium marinum]